MKTRRHHNNKGVRQVRRGRTASQVECIARRLGIRYSATPVWHREGMGK